jgi:hypothetical protein
MSFFKKIFGSTNNTDPKEEPIPAANSHMPEMWKIRLDSVATCIEAGFQPAGSLPTEFDRKLRPALDIARRLHAIKALVLWLMVPEENLPTEKLLHFIQQNDLEKGMTEEEKVILQSSRDDAALRNAIGWKFENAWPLAWYFGYAEPDITGQMMTGEQMQDILVHHTCPLDEIIENWITTKTTIAEESLIRKEDLFYCVHNAVRSAQLGSDTVPPDFDPIGNGGVIHERRHSLTWMLSNGVDWEETDLST